MFLIDFVCVYFDVDTFVVHGRRVDGYGLHLSGGDEDCINLKHNHV